MIGSEEALRMAKRAGFGDIVAQVTKRREEQVKIARSRIEGVFDWEYRVLSLFLEKDKKIISTTIENPSKSTVERLLALAEVQNLSPSEDYRGIAEVDFRSQGEIPSDMDQVPNDLDLVPKAYEALDGVGLKCAGLVEGFKEIREVATSSGAFFSESNEFYNVCLRLYESVEVSGQAVECGPRPEDLDITSCAEKARELALRARGPKRAEAGVYDVIYTPLAFADLISHVLDFSSIYNVEAGLSFLADRLGEEVANTIFSLYDDPTIDSVNRRRFDDEGVRTEKRPIIEKGVLKNYLLNTSFARKYGKESTGNAGLIAPRPWCGVVDGGDKPLESIVSQVDKGVLVTNTWYTRFQNYRTGEFSTMPRDCAILIEDGEERYPLKYLRLNDSFERMLKNTVSLSREREHIYWWEVETPVIAPSALVEGVEITTS